VFVMQIFSVACQAGLPVAGQSLLAGQPVAAANGPPLEPGQQNALTQAQLKTQLYERVLHKMRALMITKMAKPEVREWMSSVGPCLMLACQLGAGAVGMAGCVHVCFGRWCSVVVCHLPPAQASLSLCSVHGSPSARAECCCTVCVLPTPHHCGAVLTAARSLLCSRGLQEVIVVEDDNGNIVRETMKDNDVLMQYKTMREVLVYLSHLNQVDTETLMLDRLREQMQVGCWVAAACGAVSRQGMGQVCSRHTEAAPGWAATPIQHCQQHCTGGEMSLTC
jgi:hypothetical protein